MPARYNFKNMRKVAGKHIFIPTSKVYGRIVIIGLPKTVIKDQLRLTQVLKQNKQANKQAKGISRDMNS